MGYAWSKKYKVLYISMVTPIGESQADHIRTKPNGDKKETSPTISTYCRTFFIVSVLLKRQKRGTKRHGWVSKSYPLPQKTIRGYDCRKSLSMQKVSISVLILDIIIGNLFYCDFFINGAWIQLFTWIPFFHLRIAKQYKSHSVKVFQSPKQIQTRFLYICRIQITPNKYEKRNPISRNSENYCLSN